MKLKPVSKLEMMLAASTFIVYNVLFINFGLVSNFAFKTLNLLDFVSGKNKLIFLATLYFFLPLSASSMMIVSCGYYQISALNRALQSCIKNQEDVPVSDVIRATSIMFNKLCDLCDSMSSFYSVNNLFSIFIVVYFYVYLFYSTYAYVHQPSQELFEFMLTSLLWCSYFTPCALWMTIFSSWIQSEGYKTANLVHQLASTTDGSPKNFNSSYIMTLQMHHRNPKISCELFDIDWKACFLLIGSIFSYSIIMIQFHDTFIE